MLLFAWIEVHFLFVLETIVWLTILLIVVAFANLSHVTHCRTLCSAVCAAREAPMSYVDLEPDVDHLTMLLLSLESDSIYVLRYNFVDITIYIYQFKTSYIDRDIDLNSTFSCHMSV